MKRLIAIALLAASPADAQLPGGLAPPGCDYGTPNPDAPSGFADFAFLIGDYSVSAHAWTGTGWSPPRPGAPARWNGRYGLGGTVIVDEWYTRDPGLEPQAARGINVRMFNPETGRWNLMWIADTTHQVQSLEAERIDGELTMWQVYPDRADFRAVFHVQDADHWDRVEYMRDEAGEWQPRYILRATRIPCPAS